MVKLFVAKSGVSRIAKMGTLAVILIVAVVAGIVAIDSPPYFPTSQKAVGVKASTPISAQTAAPSQKVKLEFGVQDAKTPWAITLGDNQNPTVRVSKGDTVEVILTNNGQVLHDFTIQEFDVTVNADPGKIASVTLTANQAGTFTYFCSQPGHKQLGMTGVFIVT